MKNFKEILKICIDILIIGLVILYFILSFMFFFIIIYLIGHWNMFYTVKLVLFLDKYFGIILDILYYICVEPTLVPNITLTIDELFFLMGALATITFCFILYNIYYTIFLICLFFSISRHDVNLIFRKLTVDEFNFILKLYKIMIFCIIFNIIYSNFL